MAAAAPPPLPSTAPRVPLTWKWLLRALVTISFTPSICCGKISGGERGLSGARAAAPPGALPPLPPRAAAPAAPRYQPAPQRHGAPALLLPGPPGGPGPA